MDHRFDLMVPKDAIDERGVRDGADDIRMGTRCHIQTGNLMACFQKLGRKKTPQPS